MKLTICFVVLLGLVAHSTSAPAEEPTKILSQEQDSSPDGTYNYAYETANGIAASEHAVVKTVGDAQVEEVSGSASWTFPDGKSYDLSYVANENGFHPIIKLGSGSVVGAALG
ncbi:hypothetical protein NQ315_003067 [Exocentrus adspersus]|uniref:Uncharacterized protein n=1 Tax=Exocentrus adspersus TaxID=1586481 RepID=A0AAV8W528_9CUCU|nr:hypothetical protein NQ315_003067 [Exocentrus adspersus]